MNKEVMKQKVKNEMFKLFVYFSFLSMFFCSLIAYERLLLGEKTFSNLHYGYGLLQALILSKIILIGESFGLGERFRHKPLIIPTSYKTIIFSIFTFIFIVLEHFITGFFRDKRFEEIYHELLNKSLDVIFAKVIVIFLVFMLFFAFLQIGNFLGENKLLKLFFTRNAGDSTNKP